MNIVIILLLSSLTYLYIIFLFFLFFFFISDRRIIDVLRRTRKISQIPIDQIKQKFSADAIGVCHIITTALWLAEGWWSGGVTYSLCLPYRRLPQNKIATIYIIIFLWLYRVIHLTRYTLVLSLNVRDFGSDEFSYGFMYKNKYSIFWDNITNVFKTVNRNFFPHYGRT